HVRRQQMGVVDYQHWLDLLTAGQLEDAILDLADDVGLAVARLDGEAARDLAEQVEDGAGAVTDVADRVGGVAASAEERPQQGGLAGAGSSEHCPDAAAIDVIAQSVERLREDDGKEQLVGLPILAERQALETERAAQLRLQARAISGHRRPPL